MSDNMDYLEEIVQIDVHVLKQKDKEYGSSWKRRGGVGAFMMLARKWDRLENAARLAGWDIFQIMLADRRDEGVLDDIRDLRRYLLLVESEIQKTITDQLAAEITGLRSLGPTGMQNPRGFIPEEES